MSMEQEVILHHYWHSPYSRRARLFMALKDLPWRSVEMPNMMPKPELVRLTGGYRKAPVLQIGADVYCDTRLILRELDRRFPERLLAKTGAEQAIAFWLDQACFLPTVSIVFGCLRTVLPPEFVRDREALFSDQDFCFEKMSQALPDLTNRWRSLVAMIADWLGRSGVYLGGASPSGLDAICCTYVSMIAQWLPDIARPVLGEFPQVGEWSAKMNALGEGNHRPMSYEDAFSVARESSPANLPVEPARAPDDPKLGAAVSVAAADYGKEPVVGELVFCDAHEAVVRRTHTDLGEIFVHFPRAGYDVLPCSGKNQTEIGS